MSTKTDFGSFADLASIKANEVQKPKNLPDSPVSVLICGPFKENKAKSGNFSMRFPVKIVEILDPAAAEQVASDPQLQKAMEREYSIDFWMSPDARWRFTEFGKEMGLAEDLNLIEMGEALVGLGEPFLAIGKNEPSQNNPEDIFYRLDNPAPLSKHKPG